MSLTVAAPLAPTPGAPEKAAVRAMFDRIAPRYDLLNRLLSGGTDRRWRKAAVDFAELPAGARILDLCTGTGDLLIEALSRSAQSRGVGLDLAGEMLVRARPKLRARGLDARGSVASADAERLPVRDASFDAALVAFGIRNVGDMKAALVEARRVLRPGGRLVVLEFTTPGGLFGRLYRAYFHTVLPAVGRMVSGDASAYRYLPASVDRFARPESFEALMTDSGFRGVRSRPLTFGIARLFRGDT